MVKRYFFYFADNKKVFSQVISEDIMHQEYGVAKQMFPGRAIEIGEIELHKGEVLSMKPPASELKDPFEVLK